VADYAKSPPIEAIGRNVAANIKQLRRGRMSLRALETRLFELGRRILSIGLSRLENGGRRVDVDDLVALAVALDVTPNALLLPRDVPPDAEVELTPSLRVSAMAAWAWADGRMPLPGVRDGAGGRFAREMEFARSTRPAFAGQGSELAFEFYELADQIQALEAAEDPELQDMLRDRVNRTFRRLVPDLEVLFKQRPGLSGAAPLSAEQLREAIRALPEPAVGYAEPPAERR
jgi:hypothetical protein